jgi:hypothetical protein
MGLPSVNDDRQNLLRHHTPFQIELGPRRVERVGKFSPVDTRSGFDLIDVLTERGFVLDELTKELLLRHEFCVRPTPRTERFVVISNEDLGLWFPPTNDEAADPNFNSELDYLPWGTSITHIYRAAAALGLKACTTEALVQWCLQGIELCPFSEVYSSAPLFTADHDVAVSTVRIVNETIQLVAFQNRGGDELWKGDTHWLFQVA